MDKLKSVMEYVKKFGFWFLIGAVIVVILTCWWMATSSVAREVKEKASKIDATFDNVQKIAAAEQPNEKYLEALGEEHKKLKRKVFAAWQSLYEQQREKNRWPDVLGAEFLDWIKDHDKPNEEIPYRYRDTYLNFIQKYDLFETVDLRHPKEETAAAKEAAEGVAKEPEMIGVVDWDSGNRIFIKSGLNWQTVPSNLKVKLTQEDIWVYLSMQRVIKNTNGEIKEHSKATVKRIDALEIGERAVASWKQSEGQVFHEGPATGGSPSPGGPGGMPTQAAAGSQPEEKDILMKYRYVDDKGEPLADANSMPYAEFKMMPICMKLWIDQRKIAKLLVECANSPMPIEVRRVRIKPGEGEVVNFSEGSAEKAGGGSSGAMPGMAQGGPAMPQGGHGMMPGGPGMYGPGMYGPGRGGPGYPGLGGNPYGGMRPGGAPTGLGGAEWEKSAMDIPIEIQGIIYIYNPPDEAKLGTGTAADAASAETPATQPAPTAPQTPLGQDAKAAQPTAPAATPAPAANPTGAPAVPANPATTAEPAKAN